MGKNVRVFLSRNIEARITFSPPSAYGPSSIFALCAELTICLLHTSPSKHIGISWFSVHLLLVNQGPNELSFYNSLTFNKGPSNLRHLLHPISCSPSAEAKHYQPSDIPVLDLLFAYLSVNKQIGSTKPMHILVAFDYFGNSKHHEGFSQ